MLNPLFGNEMEGGEKMTRKQLAGLILLGMTTSLGCKRHYAPPAITRPNNYLVVEGTITAGQDSTIFNISRSVNVSNQSTHSPEDNAVVTVEGDQGVSYSLSETDSGRYVAAPLNLDNAHKYRLKIVTANGQLYISDFQAVTKTPLMDTLAYDITGNGLNIYASTHDPSGNTRYYRWDYTETYRYISPLLSRYKYQFSVFDSLESVPRTPAEQIDTCYVTLNSSAIIINSTAALSKAIVNKQTIIPVPKESEKIFHRYSIVVRQYGLTQDAYNFWQNMRSNTQNIGTIFDPQPSQVATNIHCTSDPSLPVLGYVSVSTVSEKRIFIDRTELPVWPYPEPNGCKAYGYCWFLAEQPPAEFSSGAVIPFDVIKRGTCGIPALPGWDVPVAGYECADCRFHLGGKTHKPAFWKEL